MLLFGHILIFKISFVTLADVCCPNMWLSAFNLFLYINVWFNQFSLYGHLFNLCPLYDHLFNLYQTAINLLLTFIKYAMKVLNHYLEAIWRHLHLVKKTSFTKDWFLLRRLFFFLFYVENKLRCWNWSKFILSTKICITFEKLSTILTRSWYIYFIFYIVNK